MESTTAKPVCPDDFFRLAFIQTAHLRGDGETVVYAVASVDEPGSVDEFERVNLWTVDATTHTPRRLTDGRWRDDSPRWSPDGSTIAFISDRSGAPQLWLMSADGDGVRQLTWSDHGVGGRPLWSPRGDLIACSTCRGRTDLTKPYRVRRAVPWADGIGFVDDAIKGVMIVPLAGRAPFVLAEDDLNYAPLAWAPDGSELYASTGFDPDDRMLRMGITAFGMSGERRLIPGQWERLSSGVMSADGRYLVCVGAPASDQPFAAVMGLWRVDVEGREALLPLSTGLGGTAGGLLQCDMPCLDEAWTSPALLLSGDGLWVYCQVEIGGTVQIWRFAVNGDVPAEAVVVGDRTCVPFNAASGRLLIGVSTLNDPLELSVVDMASGDEKQITTVNGDLLRTLLQPAVEPLHFASVDGTAVEGWFLRPPTGEPPYPTVLYIHGGPATGFGHIYSFDFQMLAAAGMAVLAVNQRGSLGYGAEFSGRIVGDWGNLDALDLLAGLDEAVSAGLADPERLGSCGLSGGGYLTCWLVSNSQRFRAAVAENPVTNFVSMHGISDFGSKFVSQWLGGAPWELPDVFRRSSPIHSAHRCTTPTLLLVGESDHRCPPEQAEQFYGVLKSVGCVVEMVRFPGASHDGSAYGDLATRRAQNEALVGWMRRYLVEDATVATNEA